VNLIKFVAIASALLMTACASQDSIIPQNGPEMKDIYRSAMGQSSKDTVIHLSEAEAICRALGLKGELSSCLQKTGRVLDKKRLSVLENPSNERLDYVPYTRDQTNEIDSLFPRLPNPDIVIYLFPHLATKSRAPIPGYSTVIPLFERVQYKMPGETISF